MLSGLFSNTVCNHLESCPLQFYLKGSTHSTTPCILIGYVKIFQNPESKPREKDSFTMTG